MRPPLDDFKIVKEAALFLVNLLSGYLPIDNTDPHDKHCHTTFISVGQCMKIAFHLIVFALPAQSDMMYQEYSLSKPL